MSSPVEFILRPLTREPLLPTHEAAHEKSQNRRRILRILASLVACFGALSTIIFWNYAFLESHVLSTITSKDSLPPLYSAYHLQELALPQHNAELPFPEGKTGKYVWFSNHVRGVGWGNVFQEHMLHALVAYNSKRSFVFNNYSWSHDDTSLYSTYNSKLIPSRIPMTALINGPLAGGPFLPGDETPRSVMREYFHEVCPTVTRLDGGNVRDSLPNEPSALSLVDAWSKILDETSDNCVEISDRPFDIFLFGSTRLLDIFPSLFASPIVTLFRWSPLIEEAFHENLPIILGQNSTLQVSSPEDPYPTIPGLLVLHLRRGDFEGHCKNMAGWGSTWTGFNQMEGLEPKRPTDEQDAAGQHMEAFAQTCYPSIPQIMQKVREARVDTPGLKRVFIMTNGPSDWISELKEALKRDADWEGLASTRDLKLNPEQTYVKQAADMLIGQRADVFIGNGFSSLTGIVVMFRMAKNIGHPRTRFW